AAAAFPSRPRSCLLLGQRGIAVADDGGVARAWPRVELIEQDKVERVGFAPETALAASFLLPNTMASAGQACWQAVTTSPSRRSRLSRSAAMRAARMRWRQ